MPIADAWLQTLRIRQLGGKMEVNVKPLNKGEVYCCSLKSAKKLFKNTSVY